MLLKELSKTNLFNVQGVLGTISLEEFQDDVKSLQAIS